MLRNWGSAKKNGFLIKKKTCIEKIRGNHDFTLTNFYTKFPL